MKLRKWQARCFNRVSSLTKPQVRNEQSILRQFRISAPPPLYFFLLFCQIVIKLERTNSRKSRNNENIDIFVLTVMLNHRNILFTNCTLYSILITDRRHSLLSHTPGDLFCACSHTRETPDALRSSRTTGGQRAKSPRPRPTSVVLRHSRSSWSLFLSLSLLPHIFSFTIVPKNAANIR